MALLTTSGRASEPLMVLLFSSLTYFIHHFSVAAAAAAATAVVVVVVVIFGERKEREEKEDGRDAAAVAVVVVVASLQLGWAMWAADGVGGGVGCWSGSYVYNRQSKSVSNFLPPSLHRLLFFCYYALPHLLSYTISICFFPPWCACRVFVFLLYCVVREKE